MVSPLGLDSKNPLFSWNIQSDTKCFRQSAYQLCVYDADSMTLLWDTGRVQDDASCFIPYCGIPLQSRQKCSWRVRIWDNSGNVIPWSEFSGFEMGLLSKHDWKARWIEPSQKDVQPEPAFDMQHQLENHEEASGAVRLNPCLFCRKTFNIKKPVKKARVYASAHGIYTLYMNDKKIGDAELTPGFTSYKKYLQYQTYRVEDYLTEGENVIGVILADGWYAGRIGMIGDSIQYGNRLAALIQLEILYSDGTSEVICSDKTFLSSPGNILYSDLFIGEKIDNRINMEHWCSTSFSSIDWTPAEEKNYGYDNLKAQYGGTVKVIQEIPAVNILTTPSGETVIDFGQVIAGRIRLIASGNPGDEIILEHSEVLDRDGNFLNNINGRCKDQRDIFILSGTRDEILEPQFTFHGFRYVKVTGYPGKLTREKAVALFLSSDMEQTGKFTSSDKNLNRLTENILYSQRSNLISIPTDCPQRERAGWTGDIQIFAPTACFNTDMYTFLKRWLRNVRAEQMENGGIPNIVPYIPSYNIFNGGAHLPASAGWGDAITIVPWVLYQKYGDIGILAENYDAMKKWLLYIQHCAETEDIEVSEEITPEAKNRHIYLWNAGNNLGDWLIPSIMKDASVENMLKCSLETKEYISTCFYARSAEILAQTAELLGEREDASYYSNLTSHIRKAFFEEYIDTNGRFQREYQGVYVLALHDKMIPEEIRPKTAQRLAELIQENNFRLDTGFVSTPFLLDVLYENGYPDLAYKILFQTKCPSWLYEVEHGATTIWESWNAILPNGTVLPVSYNHYAFGCVGDWIYREIGGLRQLKPGYKEIEISPKIDCGLNSASLRYKSTYGEIISEWSLSKDNVNIHVKIPANTTAYVILPNAELRKLKGNLTAMAGVGQPQKTAEGLSFKIGSGDYHFTYII